MALRTPLTRRAPTAVAAPPMTPLVMVCPCSAPNLFAPQIIGSAVVPKPSAKGPFPVAASKEPLAIPAAIATGEAATVMTFAQKSFGCSCSTFNSYPMSFMEMTPALTASIEPRTTILTCAGMAHQGPAPTPVVGLHPPAFGWACAGQTGPMAGRPRRGHLSEWREKALDDLRDAVLVV